MDQRSLKAFITLAETLHFGEASEICHMTTSTLSRVIKRMEEELDTCLFDRDHKDVSITSQGVQFYEFANQWLKMWNRLQHDLHSDAPQKLRGELRVACSVTSACQSFMAETLHPFMEKYENVLPQITMLPAENCIEKLNQGMVDFVVMTMKDTPGDDVNFKIISTSPLVYIFPTAWEVPQNVEDIIAKPIYLGRKNFLTQKINNFYTNHHSKPKVRAEIDGILATIAMVKRGLAGAFVPEHVVQSYSQDGHLKVANNIDIGEFVDIALLMKKNGYHSPAKLAFWDLIVESSKG